MKIPSFCPSLSYFTNCALLLFSSKNRRNCHFIAGLIIIFCFGVTVNHAAPIGGEPAAIEPGLIGRSDILFNFAFNVNNWASLQGPGQLDPDVTRTLNGFDGSGMNVFLKSGTVGNSGNGDSGTYYSLKTAGVDEKYHNEMYFRYYVQIDPNFPYVQGGKIPGMAAHKSYGGGVNPPPGEGWSARYMWNPSGELYLYAYTQSNTGWGTHILTQFNGRRAQLLKGKWHCVEQYVQLNDVGVANGKVYTWLDGNLVLKKEDMVIITATGTGAKLEWNREIGTMFQCFYGGADSGWAPPYNTRMRFDNVVFAKNYIGPRAGTGVCTQPTVSTAGGSYVDKVLVSISADPADTIRYTTNGLEPTYYSQVYTGPVRITQSCTVKARAFNDAKPYSPVSASRTFTITNPSALVANAPVISSDDSYNRGTGGGTAFGNINYGTETTMTMRDGTYGFDRRIVVKFPLSTINRSATAKLRVYFNSTPAGKTTPVVAWELPASGWTNTTITRNNSPQEGDMLDIIKNINGPGWQEWDVSNYVSGAIQRGDASIAFTLVALEDTGAPLTAFSKENSTSKPELVISTYPASTGSPTTPAAPSGATATANSATQITLTWTDNVTNETGFRIKRSANGSTGWSQIATPATNATSFADTGLSAGTAYFYRLLATNATGDSAYTSVANATTLASGGGLPVITVSQSTSGTIGAAFTYQILTSNTPTSYALASGTLPPGVTLNTSTGVLSGTPTTGTYTPNFTATNSGGTSPAVAITLTIAANNGVLIIAKPFAYSLGATNPDPGAGLNGGNGLPATNVGGNPSGTGQASALATATVTDLGTTFERVTVTDSAQNPAPAKRFARVRVTAN